MRLSISYKIIILFALLALITLALGISVYSGLESIEKSNNKIKSLNDFRIKIKELAILNIDYGAEHFSIPTDKIEGRINETEHLITAILQYQSEYPHDLQTSLYNLDQYIGYYRDAVAEMFAKTSIARELQEENREILNTLYNLESLIPRQSRFDISHIFMTLEKLWTKNLTQRENNRIPEMKKLVHKLSLLTDNEKILNNTDGFIKNMELSHVNYLAIKNRRNFLSKTNNRFLEIAAAAIKSLYLDNNRKQGLMQRLIIFLSCFAVLLTIILWYFASRRMNRFLRNINYSIHSIKSGRFNYESQSITDDELGDLVLFVRELSLSLEKEISEREQIEKEKQNLQIQLFHSQKMESIGRLAGGISHDFNNILTSLTGYSELALTRLPEDQPIRKYLKTINEGGHKAAALIRQLLAFSRKQFLETRVVNLNTIVENMSSILSRVIGEDVSLEIKTAEHLKNINADQGQIEQVMMNLAVNARDSMPDGGHLLIETSEVVLDSQETNQHDVMQPGAYVVLSISDTGVGMTQDVQERIFDPFFTTKEVGKGTGLGLSTVYGIVIQHQGHIRVFSEPGQGAAFKIYLPIVEAEEEKQEADLQYDIAKGGTETILVVEDDANIRKFITDALEPSGYRMLEASCGNDALEICNRMTEPINLLLTDVIMPGMDGKKLAERVKGIFPSIKIIFMSGYTSQTLVPFDIQENSDAFFLKKPIMVAELMQKIREALEG